MSKRRGKRKRNETEEPSESKKPKTVRLDQKFLISNVKNWLLRCWELRKVDGELLSGRIVETEDYAVTCLYS